jgi:putative hydrolase of the HAD superfamily
MAIEAVVFDLDGVVRHFDRDHLAEVERAHGLAPGELIQVAFSVLGRSPRADHPGGMGRAGGRTARQPADCRAWLSDNGEVDCDLLE